MMSAALAPELLDRARGCAVGAAVGDALGMPLEFGPPRPLHDLVREMIKGRIPAGSFTDDTEMALALAESLLAHRPLDPDDLARRFVAWAERNPPDIGTHTRRVLSRVARGTPWREAATAVQAAYPDSAGNGSVMRCWPVALAYWQQLDALRAESILQSEVTHPHPDCTAACVFVNTMIAWLLAGEARETAFERALASTDIGSDFRRVIEAALSRARRDLANSGWVRHTVESAVWGLLTTSSFEEAVVQVANLGDDADTAASVVGALAGAAYGLDAIPARWRAALRGAWPIRSDTVWSAEDFARLADRLVSLESVP